MIVIEGVVTRGRQLGRQLGFPTANIEVEQSGELRYGVYSSRVWVDGLCYSAVTNVGENPTVGEVRPRAESYILDFEGDIYGVAIRVELREWLREERRFDSLEELRAQISQDVARCREAQGGAPQ